MNKLLQDLLYPHFEIRMLHVFFWNKDKSATSNKPLCFVNYPYSESFGIVMNITFNMIRVVTSFSSTVVFLVSLMEHV